MPLAGPIIVESDGTFVNNDGAGAIGTPNGNYIVYSQNPPSSGQSYQDSPGGIDQYHLYGTDYTQTPAYLLDPTLNYQVYTFTPTLTLTAVATGADMTTGSLSVQYGTPTPGLTYYVSGLLPGDTTTAGQTMNQVLSNQPGEMTTYAQYSNASPTPYPVNFITSTEPSSLIGYNLVFKSGNILVTPSTQTVTIDVSGNKNFGTADTQSDYTDMVTGGVAGDPNFNPQFATTVGQFTNVGTYNNTISVTPASVSNYQDVVINLVDGGYTVHAAPITISATGTSIYGENPPNPTLTSTGTIYSGVAFGVSGGGTVATVASTGYTPTNPVTNTSNVNSYSIPITLVAGGANAADLSNYAVTVNPGTYTITKRALVINGSKNEMTTYDGTPQQTTFGATDYTIGATATGTGLVNGDMVGGTQGRANPTVGNAGTYLYTIGTLAAEDSMGNASGNYQHHLQQQGLWLHHQPARHYDRGRPKQHQDLWRRRSGLQRWPMATMCWRPAPWPQARTSTRPARSRASRASMSTRSAAPISSTALVRWACRRAGRTRRPTTPSPWITPACSDRTSLRGA